MVTPSIDESDIVVGQIWIALGQGTGRTPVLPAAVAAVLTTYQELLEAMVDSWEQNAEAVLAYSQELGRLAAEAARKAASEYIDVSHMNEAFAGISIICPCDET